MELSLLGAQGITLCCVLPLQKRGCIFPLSAASVSTTNYPEMSHLCTPLTYPSFIWHKAGTQHSRRGIFVILRTITEIAGGRWEVETPPSHLAASHLPCSSWHGGGRGQRRAIARAGGQDLFHPSPFFLPAETHKRQMDRAAQGSHRTTQGPFWTRVREMSAGCIWQDKQTPPRLDKHGDVLTHGLTALAVGEPELTPGRKIRGGSGRRVATTSHDGVRRAASGGAGVGARALGAHDVAVSP